MFDKKFWIETSGSKSCQKFSEVFHVCHIKNALEIVQHGTIKNYPVKNESCLHKFGLPVVWTSPREWGAGTAFGNVKFGLEWDSLIKEKHIYQVHDEDILKTFKTSTYRILISPEIYKNSDCLTSYTPTRSRGPLALKNGKWYCNENHSGHFLIESCISLDILTSIEFVDHPEKFECEGPCKEPKSMIWTGPIFLAALMGQNIRIKQCYFMKEKNGVRKLTDPIDYALSILQSSLINETSIIQTSQSTSQNPYKIMHACLLKYSELEKGKYANKEKNTQLSKEIDKLLGLIGDKEKCLKVFKDLASDYFGFDKETFPRKIRGRS